MSQTPCPPRIPPGPRHKLAARLPYWLLAMILLGILFLGVMLTNESYTVILKAVAQGVWVTVYVTLIAFTLAMLFGLLLGLMRVSGSRLAREVSTFYVELVRGVPMLVILYYIAFVGAPPVVAGINWIGDLLQGTRIMAQLGSTAGRASGARRELHRARHLCPDHRLQRLHLGDLSRRDPIHRPRPDGGRAFAGDEQRAGDALRDPAAGDPHRAAAAGERLHRHAQGFVAGLGAGGAGHHATGEGVLGQHVPVLRDVQRGGVSVPGDDGRVGAGGAGDREADAGEDFKSYTTFPNCAVESITRSASPKSFISPKPHNTATDERAGRFSPSARQPRCRRPSHIVWGTPSFPPRPCARAWDAASSAARCRV